MALCVSRTALFLFLTFAACRPCITDTPVLNPDGGVARCVQSKDCPRPGSTLECTDDQDPYRNGCIGCFDSQCIHKTPETCN